MSDPKEWTTIRVPQGAADEARDAKHHKETWGDYLRRCEDSDPEVREFVDAEELLEGQAVSKGASIDYTEMETRLKRVLKEVLRG